MGEGSAPAVFWLRRPRIYISEDIGHVYGDSKSKIKYPGRTERSVLDMFLGTSFGRLPVAAFISVTEGLRAQLHLRRQTAQSIQTDYMSL